MAASHPLISVITPTHNRAGLLPRVWEALNAQTDLEFEWIVADDGSTDGTEQLIAQLAPRSAFRVLYVRADQHVGKARIDNEAVRRAHGEFVTWCDSDDWLLPHAIERLRQCWHSIPEHDRDRYVGITAACASADGRTATAFSGPPPVDVTWNDLAEVHHVRGDMLFLVRTADMRGQPFPEVDLVIPESVVWTALGDRKTRFIHEPLKFVEYQREGGVSFSGVMAYNRGRAYALARNTERLRHYPVSRLARMWKTITFLRYCRHGDIGLREALALWKPNAPGALTLLGIPFAWALAVKDLAQGKVRKTHEEFLASRQAVISVRVFGSRRCR